MTAHAKWKIQELEEKEQNLQRLVQSVREHEMKFRRFVDSSTVAIAVASREGRISDANEVFLRLTGYSRDELRDKGVRWSEMTASEYRKADSQAATEIIERGCFIPYEKELICRDGTRVAIKQCESPINDRSRF